MGVRSYLKNISFGEKQILLLTKIFLVGLLFQFFAQTFVSFSLGWTGRGWDLVWMRKEILILVLLVAGIWSIRKAGAREKLRAHPVRPKLTIAILVLVLISTICSLLAGSGIGITILSLRYSMTGFVIFLLFAVLAYQYLPEQTKLFTRYGKVMKRLLVGSMIRWAIIFFVPRLLEFAGYDQYSYEGNVGVSPPAVYYTQYNAGYPRDQFLFERPISRGFFLVAFWPFFFVMVLKGRGIKRFFTWGAIYAIAILSTFSRASWIAWFIQTAVLLMLDQKTIIKKYLPYMIAGLIGLFGVITYVGSAQIVGRDFSNTGHFKNIEIALGKITDHRFLGNGGGSAGPASHHLASKDGEYNPENQFLQIWIEYGVVGFLGWFAIYLWFHRQGVIAYRQLQRVNLTKQQRFSTRLVLAFALGFVGLSIEGLVLHSFIDRMIVYPFMALFGIAYAWWYASKNKLK